MEGLNKKLSALFRRILGEIDDRGLLSLSLIVVAFTPVNQFFSTGPVMSTIIYGVVFSIILLTWGNYLYLALAGVAAFSTYALNYLQLSAIAAILLGLMVLFIASKELWSSKTGLFLLSNLVHFGDALTTYIGLEKGLSEQNPVVIPLIDVSSTSIFLIKALVIPVTLYIYIKMDEDAQALLKIIFLIGLYLTANNLIALMW